MIAAVLFDRDGTLIADLPDRDERVVFMPKAKEAFDLLRGRGLRIGVITNQPGAKEHNLRRIHRRIEEALGTVNGWFACTHNASEGCACRKPQPGLIHRAAAAFGIASQQCAVIGDIGSDVDAALAAGAQAVLVPTPVTLIEEVARAPVVCNDLLEAVEHVLGAGAPVK